MDSAALPAPEKINAEDGGSPHSDPVSDTHDNPFLSPSEPSHDYNCSGIYEDSTEPSGHDDTTDDEIARQNGTNSSRSSISSLPASLSASAFIQPPDTITPTKSILDAQELPSNPGSQVKSPGQLHERGYGSPFRHASSVRAMQMRDDDVFSVAHRQRDSQMSGRMFHYSGRSSSASSQTRRRARESPQKSKLKKEYPLVLLHCTLLPPTLNLSPIHPDLLQEVLPEPYWQRWRLLNDKITINSEVKTRGVLIPHPKNDYDLLEERLLESLELVKLRIKSGHYLGTDDGEQSDESDDDTAVQGAPCPDCGQKIPDRDESQKWEVKVYAANGLMRAGAWSAAWSEMEKIDVEVGVHLPEDVRRVVEVALHDISQSYDPEKAPESEQQMNEREREVYGAGGKPTQDEIDGLADSPSAEAPGLWTRADLASPTVLQPTLGDLLATSVQRFLGDKKNTAILFLSILVIWFALVGGGGAFQQKSTLELVSPIRTAETVVRTSYITTTALETPTAALQPLVVPLVPDAGEENLPDERPNDIIGMTQ